MTAPDALTALITRLRNSADSWRRSDCAASRDVNEEARLADEAADALAALAATDNRAPVEDGWRECSVCHAVVAAYPEGMCCHCHEMPWPLAAAPTPPIQSQETDNG